MTIKKEKKMKEEKKKSPIEEKIEYEKEKTKKIEKQIMMEGGKLDISRIILDASLEVVKDVLFENNLISRDSFLLRFLKKEQILLTSVLGLIRELKKKQKSKIIIPGMVPPKNLKKVVN